MRELDRQGKAAQPPVEANIRHLDLNAVIAGVNLMLENLNHPIA
jgi:hypothetical protein